MKNQKGFVHILLVLILVAGAIGVAYYFRIFKKNQNEALGPIGKYIVESRSPTPDPTANWKTYANNEFSFKYPDKNWAVVSDEQNMSSLYLKNNDPGQKYYSIDFYTIRDTTIDKAVSEDLYIDASVDREPVLDKYLIIDGKKSLQITGLGSVSVLPRQKSINTLIQDGKDVVAIKLTYESDLGVYNQILSTFQFTK